MKIIKVIGLFLCVLFLFTYLKIINNQPDLELNAKIRIAGQHAIEAIKTEFKPESSQIELSYLARKPDDTYMFGDSLAVSDQYLAVSDRHANRVVIYLRQADNSWFRAYEVYPPKPLVGKSRESNFGSDLEIKNNTLLVSSYIQQDLWGNQVAAEEVKRKLHLFTLAEEQVANLKTIDLSAKNAYASNVKFLGNNIALFIREKNADNETTSNYIELINSLTVKRVKKIELSVPGYKNTDFDGLDIDSDGESLFILPLRVSSFESKPPLLITKDGKISKVALPQSLDPIASKRYKFPAYSVGMAITNKLLAITVRIPPFDSYSTIFWQRFPRMEWIDTFASSGKKSGEENNILFSLSRPGRLIRGKPDYTFFMFSPEQKTFSQSDIEWSCAVEANEQYLASTLGLVDGDNLILGAYGTVAIVPIANLTNSQTLFNPSCRSN